MERKVRDRIKEEMERTGRRDKDYVVDLIKALDEVPDINKLIEQSYKAKADRIIASFKDENGLRDCFAIKDNEANTIYVNIAKPELLKSREIEQVRLKQLKMKKKKEETLKKAEISKKVLTGQIKMEDYQKELKKELEEVI